MLRDARFLIAITVLNALIALVTLSQVQRANAAGDYTADVLRARKLEIVDESRRVRASIVVHTPEPGAKNPDGSPQEETTVFRLIGVDGRPGVKLAASDHDVGLALIKAQGEYIQVFANGIKVTHGGNPQASWP